MCKKCSEKDLFQWVLLFVGLFLRIRDMADLKICFIEGEKIYKKKVLYKLFGHKMSIKDIPVGLDLLMLFVQ